MHFVYIAQLLIFIAGPIVKMVFRMLGIGFVTYVGVSLVITQAKNFIVSQSNQTGPVIVQILGLMKVDMALNIMIAAVTTRFIMSGLDKASGSMRNKVWLPPGKFGGSIGA